MNLALIINRPRTEVKKEFHGLNTMVWVSSILIKFHSKN